MSTASWSLRFDAGIEEALAALDRAVAERVTQKLVWLTQNAAVVRHLPLRGQLAGLYKLKLGPWRLIYELLPEERVILVLRLGHRREIYEE